MDIIACSILDKDIPENNVKAIPTILKKEAIERKNSIKFNRYQQKDIRWLSNKILIPPKDIKEKIVVFKTVLNVGLLWHTSEIFHKTERQRPRPNRNGLMDELSSEKKNKNHQKVPLQFYNWLILTHGMKAAYTRYLFYIIQQAKYLNIEIPSTNLCELKHLNSQN